MKRGPCHRPAKKPCWSSSLAGEIAIGHSADSWSYLLLNKGRLRHWCSRAGWGEGVMCALMLLVPYHPLHLQTHSKEPRNEPSMESWDFIGTRKKQTQESWDRFKHNTDCWHNLPFSYFGPTRPSWHPPTKQHCVTSTGLQTQAESQVSANDKPTATFPDTGIRKPPKRLLGGTCKGKSGRYLRLTMETGNASTLSFSLSHRKQDYPFKGKKLNKPTNQQKNTSSG